MNTCHLLLDVPYSAVLFKHHFLYTGRINSKISTEMFLSWLPNSHQTSSMWSCQKHSCQCNAAERWFPIHLCDWKTYLDVLVGFQNICSLFRCPVCAKFLYDIPQTITGGGVSFLCVTNCKTLKLMAWFWCLLEYSASYPSIEYFENLRPRLLAKFKMFHRNTFCVSNKFIRTVFID